MKINDYVKTYNLCTGKIQIGNVCNIANKDKENRRMEWYK